MKTLSQITPLAHQPKDWIVEDLILRGDQVMIAAAPKVGKTLLASQLACLYRVNSDQACRLNSGQGL